MSGWTPCCNGALNVSKYHFHDMIYLKKIYFSKTCVILNVQNIFFVFKAKKKIPSSTISQIYYKTPKDRFISLTYHQVRLSDNHTLTHFKIGWAFRHFIGCQSIRSNALFIILIPSVRRVCALRACVCVYLSIMVPEWEDVWVCLCALWTLE